MTIAAIKPPMSPNIIKPVTELGSPLLKKIFQVHEADKTHKNRYKPVLLTAPDRVITSFVEKSDERCVKALLLKAGLPDLPNISNARCRAIIFSYLKLFI